jgi:hypothetical protein
VGWFFARCAPAGATPWLFVSDIHLKAVSRKKTPSPYGRDTNDALFESALREMQRVDPHPPVVIVTGDLLAHSITPRTAIPTAVLVAQRLNRAFPQAQFVLALGNIDSDCGDYELAPNSKFLRAVAAAWEPLVNRRGAAPDFQRTFARDGFYTATLPLPGLRAIAFDDVFWSVRYHARCAPAGNVAANVMGELEAALAQTKGRAWVLFHIPPGVDAFSTAHLAHRLAIVPFLAPEWRDEFVDVLAKSAGRVALAVAGHTHKFAYRIVDGTGAQPVPMLLVPAISPIFDNAPSFLTADVTSDGTLRDVEDFAFLAGRWSGIGGMPSLGVDDFTGSQLIGLQERLARDSALRATFDRLYGGGAPPEVDEHNWFVYWCAATAFGSTQFRDCANSGGFAFVTRRGVEAAIAAAVVIALAAGGFVWWRMRRRKLRV